MLSTCCFAALPCAAGCIISTHPTTNTPQADKMNVYHGPGACDISMYAWHAPAFVSSCTGKQGPVPYRTDFEFGWRRAWGLHAHQHAMCTVTTSAQTQGLGLSCGCILLLRVCSRPLRVLLGRQDRCAQSLMRYTVIAACTCGKKAGRRLSPSPH